MKCSFEVTNKEAMIKIAKWLNKKTTKEDVEKLKKELETSSASLILTS